MVAVFRLTVVSIATVCLCGTQALAQGNEPVPDLRPELPQPSQPQPDRVESQLPTVERPTCPAGQFASAFPDVLPTDWAYEAVNRLAVGPIRCFPLPSQSSLEQR